MMQPTKAQAIERIQRAVDAIPELMSMPRTTPEFTKWHRNTSTAIENTFGVDSQHIKTFKRIRFGPAVFFAGMPDSEFQRPYVDSLGRAKAILESMIEEIEEYWQDDVQPQIASRQLNVGEPVATNRVFVVHGRDEATKQAAARYLEGLGLEPVILQEQPSQGRTIIEKFEEYAGTVGFAVVLGTPDDFGGLADEPDNRQPRMRQNVVFELGYFTHALGRNRVCVLLKGDVERPSDYDGVIYIPMDDGEGWKLTLGRELREAGFTVDLNRL